MLVFPHLSLTDLVALVPDEEGTFFQLPLIPSQTQIYSIVLSSQAASARIIYVSFLCNNESPSSAPIQTKDTFLVLYI